MEPEVPLLFSQYVATGAYCESNKYSPHPPHPISITSMLMLSPPQPLLSTKRPACILPLTGFTPVSDSNVKRAERRSRQLLAWGTAFRHCHILCISLVSLREDGRSICSTHVLVQLHYIWYKGRHRCFGLNH